MNLNLINGAKDKKGFLVIMMKCLTYSVNDNVIIIMLSSFHCFRHL